MNDNNSLAHTTWNCKYHIVFAPKYRRRIFYDEYKREIGKILRELCEWKGIKIVEAEVCPDHIHMLVEIPPKMSVAGFMGFLKSPHSLDIISHCLTNGVQFSLGRRFSPQYPVLSSGTNTVFLQYLSILRKGM